MLDSRSWAWKIKIILITKTRSVIEAMTTVATMTITTREASMTVNILADQIVVISSSTTTKDTTVEMQEGCKCRRIWVG